MTDQTIDTAIGTVEQPPPEPSGPPQGWDALAEEMFPDDYHPDREEPQGAEIEELARERAGEDADARALEADEGDEPGQAAESEPAEHDPAAADDGPHFSAAEVELHHAATEERALLSGNLAKIVGDKLAMQMVDLPLPQFKQHVTKIFDLIRSNIDANVTDRATAAGARAHLAEAERELVARYADVAAVGAHFRQKVQNHELGKAKKYLSGEEKKLAAALPSLDKAALVKDLRARGYSDSDLRQVRDHRLLVAFEESRLYRELKASGQLPGKRVVLRKGATARQQPAESAEWRAAIDDVNRFGLSRENATTIMRNLPKKSNVQPTAAQLKARLEATGSMDDAVAYMRAADRERAQTARKGARR